MLTPVRVSRGLHPRPGDLILSAAKIGSQTVIIWTDCHALYIRNIATGETDIIREHCSPPNNPGPFPSYIHQIAACRYNGVLCIASIVDLPNTDDNGTETIVAFWAAKEELIGQGSAWNFWGGNANIHGGETVRVKKCPTMHLKWEKTEYNADYALTLMVSISRGSTNANRPPRSTHQHRFLMTPFAQCS